MYDKVHYIAEHANITVDGEIILPEDADIVVVDGSGIPHIARHVKSVRLPKEVSMVYVVKKGGMRVGASDPAGAPVTLVSAPLPLRKTEDMESIEERIVRESVKRILTIQYGSALQPSWTVGYTDDPWRFIREGFGAGVPLARGLGLPGVHGKVIVDNESSYCCYDIKRFKTEVLTYNSMSINETTLFETTIGIFTCRSWLDVDTYFDNELFVMAVGFKGEGVYLEDPKNYTPPYPASIIAVPLLVSRDSGEELLEIKIKNPESIGNNTMYMNEPLAFAVQLRVYEPNEWSPFRVVGLNDTAAYVATLGSGRLDPGESFEYDIRVGGWIVDRLGPGYDIAIATITIIYAALDNQQQFIVGKELCCSLTPSPLYPGDTASGISTVLVNSPSAALAISISRHGEGGGYVGEVVVYSGTSLRFPETTVSIPINITVNEHFGTSLIEEYKARGKEVLVFT